MRDQLTAGSTWEWEDIDDEYPPSQGYSLTYVLIPQFTSPLQAPVSWTATTSGEIYVTQIGPVTTAAIAPGKYTWWRYLEKAGARKEPEKGTLDVLPDPAQQAQGFDGRSQAERAVDDLKEALATYSASNGLVSEFQIAGRMRRFRSVEEITALMNYWQGILSAEWQQQSLDKGLGNPRRIYARFV